MYFNSLTAISLRPLLLPLLCITSLYHFSILPFSPPLLSSLHQTINQKSDEIRMRKLRTIFAVLLVSAILLSAAATSKLPDGGLKRTPEQTLLPEHIAMHQMSTMSEATAAASSSPRFQRTDSTLRDTRNLRRGEPTTLFVTL